MIKLSGVLNEITVKKPSIPYVQLYRYFIQGFHDFGFGHLLNDDELFLWSYINDDSNIYDIFSTLSILDINGDLRNGKPIIHELIEKVTQQWIPIFKNRFLILLNIGN